MASTSLSLTPKATASACFSPFLAIKQAPVPEWPSRMSKIRRNDVGWSSPEIVVVMIAAMVLAADFVAWERGPVETQAAA
jgi:hypothetical protein